MQIFNENKNKNQSLISRALTALNDIVEGWHSRPVSGDKKLMVVQVNFVGTPLAASENFYNDVVWKEGDDALSVHQYYKDQSHGTLNIISADYEGSTGGPFGLITISLDTSCFNGGKHPDRLISSSMGNTEADLIRRHANEVAMLSSIVRKISEDKKVDFTKFDTNNDGKIDPSELCLYVVTAGYEESYGGYVSADYPAVWAHAWSSFSYEPDIPSASHDLKISGKIITDWAMNGECGYNKASPENPTILPSRGTMTHELGHQMCKLPDLYDISGANNGIDMYSVMGSGNWGSLSGDIPGSHPVNLDAWSRLYLGWATNPNTITPSKNTRKNVTFQTALTKEEGGIVKIANSFPSSEYILAEVRDPKNSKWDQGLQGGSIYDESKTGAVLLLHVDENVGSGALEYGNNFNSSAQPHQGVIPIAPDCYFRVSNTRSLNNLWFKGNRYLDEVSKDIAAFSAGRTYFYGGSGAYNAGVRSGIALENISDSGEVMSADITYAEDTGTYPAHPLTPILDRDMAPALDILLPNTIFTVKKVSELFKEISQDISSEDIALDDAHQTILTDEAIRRASGTKGSIHSLPIFELISQTDMPLVNMVGSFTVASADLMAKTAGEVKLLVVTGKETAKYLIYTNDKYDFVRDGYFTIQPNDKSTSMLSKNAALTDNYYRITIFAKDNGSCDMDPNRGFAVLAPAAVRETETSGGGCSAGFTAITLIFALGLIPLARNKHR